MSPTSNRLGSGLGSRFAALTAALPSGVRERAPILLAAASGALAVLGFAPFSYFVLAPLAVAGLCEALSRGSSRAGFWRGYAYGLGLLGFGVAWIRISLNEFGNMDAWVANLAMALFVASMALYYGLAGALARRLDPGDRHPWALPLLLLPGLYVLLEWLRGWLFTGFPWLNLGYTQIDGPLAGFAPLAGVYGVSLLVVLSGGLLWGFLRWASRARIAAGLALVAVWSGGAALRTLDWTRPVGASLQATVIQGNVPQSLKWDPDRLTGNVEVYLTLTRENLGSDLILWPETAIPAFLHEVRAGFVDALAERAREEGTEIVMGIPVMDRESRYYNGLLAIGSHEDLYTKRHLVPFGEFMPFRDWVGPIARLFDVPMSDFSAGKATRPLLRVGSHNVGVSICYEDAFPAEVAQALPEAEYLINVSNDAWFGDSLAPHQHLEIARMRALETGRDLVRATNTGISAIVDHRGQVLGRLPSFVRGTYTNRVQPRAGATPFVRVRNWLAISIAGLLVAAAFLAGRRHDG